VQWELAADAAFSRLIRTGSARTSPESDHTVHVDVRGLQPLTEYHYRFRVSGVESPAGRFRTAPAADAAIASLRFGVVSCANYEGGFFSAYRHLASRDDLDFILHLGDYIYEYEVGGYGDAQPLGRQHEPVHEMVTLEDYRRRHAQYKRDPDLQSLHLKAAFITTWDDHETADDAWRAGATNHQPEEGDYFARRQSAYQAYFEWMPVRRPEPNDPHRLYRQFRFGTLADLSMLDLRQYRDQQVSSTDGAGLDDPHRTLLGEAQRTWLAEGLAGSGALWKLVGNPVQIMPFKTPALPAELAHGLNRLLGRPLAAEGGPPYNPDSWDGYTAERQWMLGQVATRGIRNVVFLTGDIHSSWAADLPLDAGTYPLSPSVATELVCPSLTSDNLDEILGVPARTSSVAVEEAIRATNRHIRMVELDSHGFCIADITRGALQVDWYFLSNRRDPMATAHFRCAYRVLAGVPLVQPVSTPIGPRSQ
jgi:alkaline phosphatase D